MPTFTLNQTINHKLFGKGTITEIQERPHLEPIIYVTFDNIIRKDFKEGDIYTTRFLPSSLNQFLVEE